MSERETVEIDLELALEIQRTLRVLCEDLDAELRARYPDDTLARYPSEARRYRRDRVPVVNALYCLDQLKQQPGLAAHTKEDQGA